MQIISYSNCSELAALEDSWSHLGKLGLYFVPSFPELRNRLEADRCKFRLFAAIENSQITSIACFIFGTVDKTYEVASRTLFRLPVKMVELFGSCVLGEPSEIVIREFFHRIIEEGGFDVINIGHIFIQFALIQGRYEPSGRCHLASNAKNANLVADQATKLFRPIHFIVAHDGKGPHHQGLS